MEFTRGKMKGKGQKETKGAKKDERGKNRRKEDREQETERERDKQESTDYTTPLHIPPWECSIPSRCRRRWAPSSPPMPQECPQTRPSIARRTYGKQQFSSLSRIVYRWCASHPVRNKTTSSCKHNFQTNWVKPSKCAMYSGIRPYNLPPWSDTSASEWWTKWCCAPWRHLYWPERETKAIKD